MNKLLKKLNDVPKSTSPIQVLILITPKLH